MYLFLFFLILSRILKHLSGKSMEKLLKKSLFLMISVCMSLNMFAQAQRTVRGKMLFPAVDLFQPHWEVSATGGLGYDIGEAPFGKLLSPAVQLTGGYHFNEYFSMHLSVSGFMSRNEYAFPHLSYKWYYIQPALDFKLDVLSLFTEWNPLHFVRPYIFAGAGANISFGNGDAVDGSKIKGVDFQKLWSGSRFNPVIRAGVGCNFWITDRLGITAEVNANMLPDHYNSKRGRNDNRDWHFNGLVGVRFRLSNANNHKEAVYEQIPVMPDTVATRSAAPQKITRDMADLVINVLFEINKSIIRPDEEVKLSELLIYMQQHPECHVLLTGYADRDTGTPVINERLSRERSIVVAEYLKARGITEDRLHVDHKGDRIQPFDFPAANRVTICIVLNKMYVQP